MTLCLSGEHAFSDSGAPEVYEVPRRVVCVGAPPGARVGPARAEGERADIQTE
jgi:hypothetical protein